MSKQKQCGDNFALLWHQGELLMLTVGGGRRDKHLCIHGNDSAVEKAGDYRIEIQEQPELSKRELQDPSGQRGWLLIGQTFLTCFNFRRKYTNCLKFSPFRKIILSATQTGIQEASTRESERTDGHYDLPREHSRPFYSASPSRCVSSQMAVVSEM